MAWAQAIQDQPQMKVDRLLQWQRAEQPVALGWVLMEALVLEVQIQAAVQADSYRYLGAIIS